LIDDRSLTRLQGEQTAQICVKAWFRQLIPPRAEIMNEAEQEFCIRGLSG
jgi:hypothetical protein